MHLRNFSCLFLVVSIRFLVVTKDNWDCFRSSIAEPPLSALSKSKPSRTTSLTSEWILSAIESFISHKNTNKNQTAGAFHTWICCGIGRTLAFLRTEHSYCKRVLENAKNIYAQTLQDKVDNKNFGFCRFWKILNAILSRDKLAVPYTINGPEIISSSLDKAKLFVMNFEAIYYLISPHQNFVISQSILDSKKATDSDKIPVVVLKDLDPQHFLSISV